MTQPIDRRTHRVTITPAAAQRLFISNTHGVAHGHSEEQIIAEDVLNGREFQVSLREDADGWTVVVRGRPPLSPDLMVSLHAGPTVWHQAFSLAGEASFSGLAEDMLRDGFDLVLILPPLSG